MNGRHCVIMIDSPVLPEGIVFQIARYVMTSDTGVPVWQALELEVFEHSGEAVRRAAALDAEWPVSPETDLKAAS